MKARAAMPGGARDSRAAIGDPPKAPSVRVVSRAAVRAPVFAAGRRKQHAGRVLHPIFAACAWLIFAVCAQADSLRADFSPLTLRPRTNAPAIFDIKLHRQGAGLLEGALEITFEGRAFEVLLRQRTQDLTLPAGTQSFRIITPPLPQHESYNGTDAHLRFVTKTAAVDLGSFPVEAASRGTRNFVIAVCDTHAAGVRDVALWQSLRLEIFLPVRASADKLIATSPAYLAPEDFPANPLALFAFDLVLLDGDGFALLREKQLAALTRWVEAGGSLCVLPGRGLKDEHARFLNAFISGKNPALFQIMDTGEWVPNGNQPRLLRAGLGRVVVGLHPADDTLIGWTEAGAFLWKLRGTAADFFPGGIRSNDSINLAASMQVEQEMARQRRDEMGQLLNTLLPHSTHLISPKILALILAGFLLVVGPLDWLLLGIIRRRRWTWIVFPLVSAGFTALVISEAGRALGHEDHRAALIITDVGPGGRVLRESRFELLFSARNQESLTEIRNAFAVPTTFRGGGSGRRSPAVDAEPVWFSGQVPVRFTMRQQLRQWTPQFNRVTTIETSDDASGIPWKEIETRVVPSRSPKVEITAIANRQSNWDCALFHHMKDDLNLVRQDQSALERKDRWQPVQTRPLCASWPGGLSQFVARISPDGSDNFEDLLLLDAHDPNEWLLVISRRTPDGVHLYRRLFRTED